MENKLVKNPGEQHSATEIKKESSILELFNLNEQEKLELKERVKKHKGLARVFIHPITVLKGGGSLENQERATAVLARTVLAKTAPPVIVFENSSKAAEHWKRSTKNLPVELPHEIYIVPTVLEYPFPLIPGKNVSFTENVNGNLTDEQYAYSLEGIKKFVDFLDSVGVKKIMVGGTELEVIHDRLNKCVGNFIEFMKDYRQIELKLSFGTAPINKSDLKKTNPGLVENL